MTPHKYPQNHLTPPPPPPQKKKKIEIQNFEPPKNSQSTPPPPPPPPHKSEISNISFCLAPLIIVHANCYYLIKGHLD